VSQASSALNKSSIMNIKNLGAERSEDALLRQPQLGHPLAAFLSLGFGGFFIGTGEFVSMSLLPALAQSTQISVPAAGSYISAYALGVVVGAPVLAVIAAKWPQRLLLIVLMALFVLGYLASVFASGYSSLLLARFIAGFPHGAYYGVACLVAASLVAPEKKAQATGYVMVGLAAANVAGVPLATWIGQLASWKATFAVLAGGGVVTMLLLWRSLPCSSGDPDATVAQELGALKNLQVWLTLLTAALGFGGMFAVYSYITPTLTQVSGFTLPQVPWVLSLWGLGMVVGNFVGGWLADRGLNRAIFLIMAWNIVCLAAFAMCAANKTATLIILFLLGGGFALVPALQVRLMEVAGKAQTLAASLNHSAFNASNALGASLGGWSVAAGYGWASTGWVACVLACLGVGMMLLCVWSRR